MTQSIIKRTSISIILISIFFFQVSSSEADNPGDILNSNGVPGAVINLDGVEGVGEWAGFLPFNIPDYGGGDALSATGKALHKGDGIYILVAISDSSNNNNDAVNVRFDINHSHGAMSEATDWGIEVRRNGQATWGSANSDPGTWISIPAANVGVSPPMTDPWTVEVRLPTGLPSNLDLSTGTVGIHFKLFNAGIFGVNSAIYTQWPQPVAMEGDDINDLFDNLPDKWANYIIDPVSTFPDIAVTGVRNAYNGSENYRKISHSDNNLFQIEVKNPGGTAIADAHNVRLNLYLAARGIGESWHRLDTAAVLDGDCAAPTWASGLINKNEVCSGAASHPDISTQNINDIVDNSAVYTVKDGMPINRLGGESITIAGGFDDWISVLEWNTTSSQDQKFTEVDVGGTIYRRQHQCMKAEAIVPNDPNTSNNLKQVNMDFVCVPAYMFRNFDFTLGWAGFSKYDPGIGKKMFLHVGLKNMDKRDGWQYNLEGVQPLREGTFVAKLKGKKSLPLQLSIKGPATPVLGETLKENLIVPPKAGGKHANVKKKSGKEPVYVKVRAGSTILIANYGLDEKDIQYVDLDGREKFLPKNGLDGLYSTYIEKVCKRSDLLAPHINPGALVGSFDNFRTAFKISEGVQVKVPKKAKYLSLGINDCVGAYDNNSGTGFRVKITQRSERGSTFSMPKMNLMSEAMGAEPAEKLQIIPISEVMPTLCIKGYEAIGQERSIGGKQHELYRYIGEVRWGIINVYPRDRSKKPDRGDPFGEGTISVPNGGCAPANMRSFAYFSIITILGIVIIRQRVFRKKN